MFLFFTRPKVSYAYSFKWLNAEAPIKLLSGTYSTIPPAFSQRSSGCHLRDFSNSFFVFVVVAPIIQQLTLP